MKPITEIRRFGLGSLLLAALYLSTLNAMVWAESSVQVKEPNVKRPQIEKNVRAQPALIPDLGLGAGSVVAVEPSRSRYLVALLDPAVARYRGGVEGYAASSTAGRSRLDIRSTNAQAYGAYLATTQEKLVQTMTRVLGRGVEPLAALTVASNTLVLELTPAEAVRVAQLQGVRSVAPDRLLQLDQTTSLGGYAMPGSTSLNPFWSVVALVVFLLLLATFIAWRRGWLGRNLALFALMASSLGLVGCFYEGGFQWIGAPLIWHGSADLEPTRGEGVIVGVIDTGINPISASFAAVSDDGYRHHNPLGSYVGVCDPGAGVYDPSFPCNDKLIGAWGVAFINNGSPRDQDGHGSHTAGTAAGNLVYQATVTAPTGFSVSKTIAGVAPRANIIAYSVCADEGCYSSAILFAINQAILDGVDVINYSIGGSAYDPWDDSDSLSFLAAMDAGIFVATSAGNSGPDFATIGSPADAPWLTSVAASSHNYFYKNSLVGLTDAHGDTMEDIIGQSITPGYGPAALVDAADYGNPLCLAGGFNVPFHGEIVICDAGIIARVAKGQNVLDNGAGGLILTRPPRSSDGSGYLEADTHVLPATHITYADASRLRSWLGTSSGHQARLTGTTAVRADDYADVLAYFSSRGVNPTVPTVIKPNITAPGRAIFAAFNEAYSDAEQDYNIIQGTSMSSPHIAGAGALLTALHPDWTPMQIQSAMMTTANVTHFKEDGQSQADPFDVGAGRIDLPQAARAALLLDETLPGFLAADPYFGGNPALLNLASLADPACVVDCRWTRTVTNVASHATDWLARSSAAVAVSPERFRLAPGASTELTFVADASTVAVGQWLFDQVVVKAKSPAVPDVHFPVAALSALSNLPSAIEISAVQAADVVSLRGLKAIEITAASVDIRGLAKSTRYADAVISDPTNGDPFDGGFDPSVSGQALFMIDVPADASRFVAQISASQSEDLDLFVGTGSVPGFATLLAYAASGSALEYLNIDYPPAGPLWVVVQNWEGGHRSPQDFSLHLAMVTGDTGNMTVTVPYSQPAGELFSADIGFVLPGSLPGDRYYGSFSLGTDSAHPANLGTIGVDLLRQ
ncbi:S8 family serine peptidase [Reinekea sp.]|uniref:S8 family serine peptidase n=1 Tax=Reinekea sp. TaxID=1970455 RepID=UPI002A81CC14|nr:S8 family serine peptidase [Reinekea sp.]